MKILFKINLLALLLVSLLSGQNVFGQQELCRESQDGTEREISVPWYTEFDWQDSEDFRVWIPESDLTRSDMYPELYTKVDVHQCREVILETKLYDEDVTINGEFVEEVWLFELDACIALRDFCSLPHPSGDDDNDEVPNFQDNCPLAYNPDQTDTDEDGKGNICDDDDDDDTVMDSFPDNCRLMKNLNQADNDSDQEGDVCDLDDDNDGVLDGDDNCPMTYNEDQSKDLDNDGVGDACDYDLDGDNWPNEDDNCPVDFNPGQENEDGDTRGDACDPDSDLDGVDDDIDNCPMSPNPAQEDRDGNGLGDECDCDFVVTPLPGKKAVVYCI